MIVTYGRLAVPISAAVVSFAALTAPVAVNTPPKVAYGALTVPAPPAGTAVVTVAGLSTPPAPVVAAVVTYARLSVRNDPPGTVAVTVAGLYTRTGFATVDVASASLTTRAVGAREARVTFAALRTKVTSLVANAGPDQVVEGGDLVGLVGAAGGGTATSYTWSQVSGPAVVLSGTGASRTFTALRAFDSATLVFGLFVNDGPTVSPQDTVTVTVRQVTEGYLDDSGVWQPMTSRAL